MGRHSEIPQTHAKVTKKTPHARWPMGETRAPWPPRPHRIPLNLLNIAPDRLYTPTAASARIIGSCRSFWATPALYHRAVSRARGESVDLTARGSARNRLE